MSKFDVIDQATGEKAGELNIFGTEQVELFAPVPETPAPAETASAAPSESASVPPGIAQPAEAATVPTDPAAPAGPPVEPVFQSAVEPTSDTHETQGKPAPAEPAATEPPADAKTEDPELVTTGESSPAVASEGDATPPAGAAPGAGY